MKQKVCTSCGFTGKAINQCLESLLLDLLVWFVSISIIFMTALIPLIIVPVAWTIFHIINFKSKCPECESLDMVSKTSAKGKAALSAS